MRRKNAVAWILVATFLTVMMFSGCSIFKKPREEVIEVPIPTPEDIETPMMPPPVTPATGQLGVGPKPITPIVRPTGQIKNAEGILRVIYFDFDKDGIRPDQRERMDHNAQYLLEKPEVKVLVEGHCDKRGTIKYNFGLGQRRVTTVRNYLILRGIDGDRVAIVSKGELEPVDPDDTDEAYAKNRRCEFKFLE